MTEEQAKALMREVSNLFNGHKATYSHHYNPMKQTYELTVYKVDYQMKEDDDSE